MNDLRRNVQLVRKGTVPLAGDLAGVLRSLKTYEEVLRARSANDLRRLGQFLPAFEPFEGIRNAQDRIDRITGRFRLTDSQRAEMAELGGLLRGLRLGTGMRTSLETSSDTRIRQVLFEAPEAIRNEALYQALARSLLAKLNEGELRDAVVLAEEVANIVRRLRTDVKAMRRKLGRLMASVDRAAESSEAQGQLVIGVAAGIALLGALGVMVWVGLTLRPLSRLQEGARRVAQGDYTAVDVRTSDEIGLLAREFNEMAAHLAERDRMLAVQSEELLRSERLATIGKMSSQITHEIRNPLSSIGLNTELLEDELSDLAADRANTVLEARQLLTAIRGEIERLTEVTEQYLRFARLPRPDLEETDLNALVTDLLAFTGEELAARSVALEVMLHSDLAPIPLDPNQLRQAVLNLVRNAMEAMDGGGTLRVSTRRLDSGVGLDVADDGPGIPLEARQRIFDPFFSTKPTGTGLGLPLVQQIVHEHGGTIVCDSAVGRGTTFRIRLPSGAESVDHREGA